MGFLLRLLSRRRLQAREFGHLPLTPLKRVLETPFLHGASQQRASVSVLSVSDLTAENKD